MAKRHSKRTVKPAPRKTRKQAASSAALPVRPEMLESFAAHASVPFFASGSSWTPPAAFWTDEQHQWEQDYETGMALGESYVRYLAESRAKPSDYDFGDLPAILLRMANTCLPARDGLFRGLCSVIDAALLGNGKASLLGVRQYRALHRKLSRDTYKQAEKEAQA